MEEDPAQPYLDDIAVADQTWQDHLQHLRRVFQICRVKRISLKKSQVPLWEWQAGLPGPQGGIQRDSAAGHEGQGNSGVSTKKNLQSFLGLVGYYRAHIPAFSTRAAPLTDLVQKTESELNAIFRHRVSSVGYTRLGATISLVYQRQWSWIGSSAETGARRRGEDPWLVLVQA